MWNVIVEKLRKKRAGTVTRASAALKASPKSKRGAWRLPFLLICCVASEARKMHVCFTSDAHRKSGVISCGAALSPVES
jgi:hypothetical protein